jgi:hypothetical protein
MLQLFLLGQAVSAELGGVSMTEEKGEKDYLDGQEAVDYLIKRWEIETYSMGAFRMYRMRLRRSGLDIEPDLGTGNSGFWKPETLDKIPPPKSRGRPRKEQRSGKDESEKAA